MDLKLRVKVVVKLDLIELNKKQRNGHFKDVFQEYASTHTGSAQVSSHCQWILPIRLKRRGSEQDDDDCDNERTWLRSGPRQMK